MLPLVANQGMEKACIEKKKPSLLVLSYPVTLINEKRLPKKEDVGEGETIKKTNMSLKMYI